MLLCTIGFSKKGLRDFISRLQRAGITKVIDVRLNNTSQLAGYAKKDDLAYILELVGIEYEHRTDLAPTESLLKDYKQKRVTWDEYEQVFLHNLAKRNAWGEKHCFPMIIKRYVFFVQRINPNTVTEDWWRKTTASIFQTCKSSISSFLSVCGMCG